MSHQQPSSNNSLSEQHIFFVGMHHGTFTSEVLAVAGAGLPPNCVSIGEFKTAEGSKLVALKAPPGTTDTQGLEALILEPTATGAFHLWLSSTDLSRATRSEADDDMENFQEVSGGKFRVFERTWA
jgi:hypothetical protein